MTKNNKMSYLQLPPALALSIKKFYLHLSPETNIGFEKKSSNGTKH